jgi:hypothetical protein
LPRGANADDVSDALDRVLGSWSYNGVLSSAPRGLSEADWAALAADGRLPRISGQLPDAETLSRARLRAIGGDRFELVFTDPRSERTVVLADEAGLPWQLSLSKLLQFGAGAP